MPPVLVPSIAAAALTGALNNTWLLDGPEPCLIDAGNGDASHVDAVARALAGRPLARVIVTHQHADHVAGLPRLRDRWPSIECCGWHDAAPRDWRPVIDGEHLIAGGTRVQVVHTPGHAPDHIALWDEATRDLYAGDLVILGSSVMIPAGHGGDLFAYMSSLERVAALHPRRLLPAHGALIEQPAQILAKYIAHRRQRELEILACLADGVSGTAEIVARIYPGLEDALHRAASLTVDAHLEKLRSHGPWT